MKKLKSITSYNLIVTFLYVFIAPINFLMDWWSYGLKESIQIEKDNLNNLIYAWVNWKYWLFRK